MPYFSYRALDAGGVRVAGEIEAADRRSAIQRLQAQGLIPIDAAPARGGAVPAAGGRGPAAPLQRQSLGSLLRLGGGGDAKVTIVTRELATLLRAGETLEHALEMVAEDIGGGRVGAALEGALGEVRAGKPLSEALAGKPDLFSRMYLGMVRAGEATGRLDASLEELATLRERKEELDRKLTSAMIYPIILTLTALVSIGLMLTVVVPQFAPLFRGNEALLPQFTRWIFALSSFLEEAGGRLVLVLALMLMAGLLIARIEAVKRFRDRLVLELPLIGGIVRERVTAQVGRGLASLLRGGLDLPAALSLLQDMVSNSVVRDGLARTVTAVRQGRRLASALEEERILVPMALRVLRTGEESGKLTELAGYVASRFEERFATRLTRLVALAEPLLVVTLGLVVGAIVLSILTAVLSINQLAF